MKSIWSEWFLCTAASAEGMTQNHVADRALIEFAWDENAGTLCRDPF